MLLDSNIIIYAAQSEYAELRHFIVEHVPAVSAVSYVEVLGYHKLSHTDRAALEEFFAAALVLPITYHILDQAVELRRVRKMTLGDSLVAATCLVHKRKLVTRNTKDFSWVTGLDLFNPFPT